MHVCGRVVIVRVVVRGRRGAVRGARRMRVHEGDGLRAVALLQCAGRACSVCPPSWA